MAVPNLDLMQENAKERRSRINRPRWNPKQWHPVYEEVVMLDVMGYKRTEIATMKGFTPAHITNICKSKEAEVIRSLVINKLRDTVLNKSERTIEERMDAVASKAVERIEAVIENDELAEKSPFAVFDRATTYLRSVGKIKDPDRDTSSRPLMIPVESMKILMDGIRVSDEAKRLHSGNVVEGEFSHLPSEEDIEEADYELADE